MNDPTISQLQEEIDDLKHRLHYVNEVALRYQSDLKAAQATIRELEWKLEIRS